jgi:ABC-type cobalamin/Fe3+-siderophores transport system ATPase subunit
MTTELVGRLAARLEQARPLVLVGASGSGKSSLLRAGLLPALSAGTLLVPGSRTWPRLLCTPTADPVGELAAQVARLAGVEPGVVRVATASAVFDAVAHARLITVDEDAAEITHETLLRAWPRLRGWIDADRAGLYVPQQLTEAT